MRTPVPPELIAERQSEERSVTVKLFHGSLAENSMVKSLKDYLRASIVDHVEVNYQPLLCESNEYV